MKMLFELHIKKYSIFALNYLLILLPKNKILFLYKFINIIIIVVVVLFVLNVYYKERFIRDFFFFF